MPKTPSNDRHYIDNRGYKCYNERVIPPHICTLRKVAEMPIIRITTAPDYQMHFGLKRLSVDETQMSIKVHFSKDLPELMVRYAAAFGIDPMTPQKRALVINDDFGNYTVNAPGVWFQVFFSEDEPPLDERMRIRDFFDEFLMNWFSGRDLLLDNYIFDLYWGSTNGKGIVNGVRIAW